MKHFFFIGIIIIAIITQSCDPLYSLFLVNKTDKCITYRVKEQDTLYVLDFKLLDYEKTIRIEEDSSFVKHYFQDSVYYTEIILNPNEFVSISGGIGNRPIIGDNEKHEVIVDKDTFRLSENIIFEKMLELETRRFFYEFKLKKK
ncbi:MAG: hypothetical protein JEY96_16730 [Bacteroidales bacterium]|nr:hypothetical protein [Bacteroidales bacterium]